MGFAFVLIVAAVVAVALVVVVAIIVGAAIDVLGDVVVVVIGGITVLVIAFMCARYVITIVVVFIDLVVAANFCLIGVTVVHVSNIAVMRVCIRGSCVFLVFGFISFTIRMNNVHYCGIRRSWIPKLRIGNNNVGISASFLEELWINLIHVDFFLPERAHHHHHLSHYQLPRDLRQPDH